MIAVLKIALVRFLGQEQMGRTAPPRPTLAACLLCSHTNDE